MFLKSTAILTTYLFRSTMSFKIPTHDLATFSWNSLSGIEEICHGGFGSVHIAEYRNKEFAVKKSIIQYGEYHRSLFMKECKMLSAISHKNIVQFIGYCPHPLAMMLELCYFDFSPFGRNKRVNNVKDLMSYIHTESIMSGFEHLPVFIAKDICYGLRYLHFRNIVHRDLKPLNVLVSNQSYCKSDDPVALEQEWKKSPLICKLTDFGESRSNLLQIGDEAMEKTKQIKRGRTTYNAPELICPLFALASASQDNLKQADMWRSLGVTFFILFIPYLSLPYMKEIKANMALSAHQVLKQKMVTRKKPANSDRYRYMQENVCSVLGTIVDKCLD